MNKREFDQWASQQRRELSDRQRQERAALELQMLRAVSDARQNHERIYGAQRRETQQKVDAIIGRQENAGIFYKAFGGARRDQTQLETCRAILTDITGKAERAVLDVRNSFSAQQSDLSTRHSSENIELSTTIERRREEEKQKSPEWDQERQEMFRALRETRVAEMARQAQGRTREGFSRAHDGQTEAEKQRERERRIEEVRERLETPRVQRQERGYSRSR